MRQVNPQHLVCDLLVLTKSRDVVYFEGSGQKSWTYRVFIRIRVFVEGLLNSLLIKLKVALPLTFV